MYDKTSLGILKFIYLEPGIHKRGLSRKLKLTMPSIDHGLKKIDNLIVKQKSGNQIKFYLDFSKKAISSALCYVEYLRYNLLASKIKISIDDFLKELKEKPLMVILFGSYAKGDYTKVSDIDILLVFQNKINTKDIENLSKKISMRTNTRLNPVYIDYNSFKESFHNPTKPFFRNLKKDRIILIGVEWWRLLEDEET